jgi:alkylated DNA nucleotide flippase Atl1
VSRADDHERYVEAVLRRVEQIPPGRVSTYSAIAAAVGRGGPRQVGLVLAGYGAAVPWWRVVRADGSLPPAHRPEALARYAEEETPLVDPSANAVRVLMAAALWTPASVD